MTFEVALKLLAGALAGAGVGLLLSRARACCRGAAGRRLNVAFFMLAGAVFGAAVAWYLMRPK